MHAFIVFIVPVIVYQESFILSKVGHNTDIWSISLISFTCLYSAVTTKIIIWTRWWTKVSYFFYSAMSVLVYILYVWFSNYWNQSNVQYSVYESV
jgi:hypothetical protein